MSLPLTRKILEDWAGTQVFQDGVKLWERGTVIRAEFDPPTLRGVLEIRRPADPLRPGCPARRHRGQSLPLPHQPGTRLGLRACRGPGAGGGAPRA
jgi:hypothetical protein